MRCRVHASGRVTLERTGSLVVLAEGSEDAATVTACEALLVLTPGLLVVATQLQCMWRDVSEVRSVVAISLGSGRGTRVEAVERLFGEGGWYCGPSDVSAAEGRDARPQFVFNWSTWSDEKLRRWSQCLMWGFVGAQDGCVLIARRANGCAGVRYRSRGAVEGGHVANHVELEQIVGNNRYVQVRGSVPVAWSQDHSGSSLNPAIVLGSDEGRSGSLLRLHIDSLKEEYGELAAVSLLKRHCKEEGELHRSYSRLLRQHCGMDLREFDLHKECGRDRYDRLRLFAESLPIEISPQSVVIRTNCKDSIDRAGLMQARIFEVALAKQLKAEGRSGAVSLAALYVECGNKLSIAYCGTCAVREEIVWGRSATTRLGRLKDVAVGALRYYCNAWLDEEKHLAVSAVLGSELSLAHLKKKQSQQGLVEQWRPRLTEGFVTGPIHALWIALYIVLFCLSRRNKT